MCKCLCSSQEGDPEISERGGLVPKIIQEGLKRFLESNVHSLSISETESRHPNKSYLNSKLTCQNFSIVSCFNLTQKLKNRFIRLEAVVGDASLNL